MFIEINTYNYCEYVEQDYVITNTFLVSIKDITEVEKLPIEDGRFCNVHTKSGNEYFTEYEAIKEKLA